MNGEFSIKIKRLTASAVIPKRATALSAGYDLCADIAQEITIAPGEIRAIGTGIAIEMHCGTCAGFVFARSGLAARYGLCPANAVGVIDADYRGEVIVPLQNNGSQPYAVSPGERIAQLVVMPVLTPETEEVTQLGETDRGSGGFGSTGTKKP